ncbi:MAG: diaminopimelate epimerase [Gammaproteobacteria bacterium]|nr:diaminopimelate epimerase [Gammaproteobacteria bacterium]MDH3428582.1 diaminopimelate epimerase [Gammaproteobacteria bacterium]MDH3432388.1 diaminopimelate epimerase [Gammaproteobacteria bacterium]
MQFAYLKMQGAGNRIVVVDQRRKKQAPPSRAELRKLGDERSGPGFDQLMWVGPAVAASAAASYRVFNADGSEVEQCGNGVRCVAWMLAQERGSGRTFVLESPAGLIEATVLDDARVTVNMGPPEFAPARIPFLAETQADRYTLDVLGRSLDVSVLSMGNPHCVLEVADVATADVAVLGAAIERHERFPAAANVGFRHIRDRTSIDLRVHERGVGETLACGTGACAAVVAGRQLDRLDTEVAVHLPGGRLVVSWRGDTDPVWLTGDAELISEGTVDL